LKQNEEEIDFPNYIEGIQPYRHADMIELFFNTDGTLKVDGDDVAEGGLHEITFSNTRKGKKKGRMEVIRKVEKVMKVNKTVMISSISLCAHPTPACCSIPNPVMGAAPEAVVEVRSLASCRCVDHAENYWLSSQPQRVRHT
jgi:hypothetical protein